MIPRCCLSIGLILTGFVVTGRTAEDGSARDPRPAIKNVLMIVADDLKASVLGCYGDSIS